MENVKSSLKELKNVLVELQTTVVEIKAQPTAQNEGFSSAEEKELIALRQLRDKTNIVISSIINKLENRLKNI